MLNLKKKFSKFKTLTHAQLFGIDVSDKDYMVIYYRTLVLWRVHGHTRNNIMVLLIRPQSFIYYIIIILYDCSGYISVIFFTKVAEIGPNENKRIGYRNFGEPREDYPHTGCITRVGHFCVDILLKNVKHSWYTLYSIYKTDMVWIIRLWHSMASIAVCRAGNPISIS